MLVNVCPRRCWPQHGSSTQLLAKNVDSKTGAEVLSSGITVHKLEQLLKYMRPLSMHVFLSSEQLYGPVGSECITDMDS